MSLIKRTNRKQVMLPDLLEDFFSRKLFNWGNNHYSATDTTLPAVNIKETADRFEVEVAAPGMRKEDFSIILDHNYFMIASSKLHEENQTEQTYSQREFSCQSFTRGFQLPQDVADSDGIQATYENGLLRLTIPKKRKPNRKFPKPFRFNNY